MTTQLFLLLSALVWTASEGFGCKNLIPPLSVLQHHPGARVAPNLCYRRNAVDTNHGTTLLSKKPYCHTKPGTALFAEDPSSPSSSSIVESDQAVLGVSGTIACLIVFYSEYTLKMTGCGLPAGPFGLLGAGEGVSYLLVVGLAAFSLYTKVRTGSGLPAGPGGILGAAEGLSFLAIVAGLVVLGFQIVDYGYIPNAVPMEGGMCT